ncbi:serine hydrolase domain-containing protein [Streptomyces sp. NPDC020875]|uniref:serine hydrolase domain-containing protein n=1 Tax=Streptomyces sp. NPDC020875 TaxID=3154898 RepID=UPI0033F0129B
MTPRTERTEQPERRLARRSVLGALGAGALAAGAALTTGAAPAKAGLPAAAPTATARTRRDAPHPDLLPGGALDAFVADLAARDVFSGTVLVARDGRTALSRSYGTANRETGLRNGPRTVFGLASVTKCLTGLAIARLASRGLVGFHERLGTYTDRFPAAIADTTLHQLLTHTSGIGRPPVGGGPPQTWNGVEETVENTLRIIGSTPPRFAPGTRFGYSNDGYWLLGAVVAAVSGRSYYDYVREEIFTPAGMTASGFLTRPDVRSRTDVARPYWSRPSGGERVDFTTTPAFGFIGGPDSGAYSTAPDLLRLAEAVRAGTLLHPAYTELITTGKVPVPPRGADTPAGEREYAGYGFHEFVTAGLRLYGHPGGGPGTATNIDIDDESGWTVIALGNYDTGTAAVARRAREIVAGAASA